MKYTHFLVLTFFFGLSANAQHFKVPVYTVTSLHPAHSGAGVHLTIDKDNSTYYHSDWDNVGVPDQLDFYFTSRTQPIKLISYTPRPTGLNGVWTNVDVLYSTQKEPGTFIPLITDVEWEADNEEKHIYFSEAIEDVAIVRFVVNSAYADFSSCAEMRFFSEEESQTEEDCVITTEELLLNNSGDIKASISLTGSYASSYQPGENIEKSFDDNLNTLYHSSWTNTSFPVTLNYRLDGNTMIDYLKYIPRSDGGFNGNFGHVSVAYNSVENEDYVTLLEYDFNHSDKPAVVEFPMTIKPLNIQFTVHDGYGGFASCAEMEFYSYGHESNPPIPASIFADDICAELRNTVTQAEIDTIESDFYRTLAQCLYDSSYDKKYRVGEYEVFQPLQLIHKQLKVSGYDPYENPTGIVFQKGDKVALFARDLPQNTPVHLLIKDFEEGYYGRTRYYLLDDGLNVFEVENSGLGYISYYHEDLSLPEVRINIVSGLVNGYYDSEKSTAIDWVHLLEKETYPKMDILGEYTHLVYDRKALRVGCPFDGHRLIKKYDKINAYERLLMGLYKYDKSPKNHILSFSDDDGGWYAGGTGIHLDLSWGLHNIVNPDELDLWGIPHEFGHINQIRPDLKWIGTTEVTNNIYSLWVYYKMNPRGENYTRLESGISAPSEGMPSVAGGTINGLINSTYVMGNPLQHNVNYDVFKVLVPFWQLQLYYQLAGAARNAPELTMDYPGSYNGVDYARWYGTVAEVSRNTDSNNLSNGELVMNFVRNTCDAVEEDLTDFFTHTGFLKPIDVMIDDYGMGQLTITEEMIENTKTYIHNQGYHNPISPVIHYMSAHSVNIFKNRLPLTGKTGVGINKDSDLLVVQQESWPHAVAFEIYDSMETLMHVAIVGTGDISLKTTKIYFPDEAYKVYAVGYDGKKILVYPEITSMKSPAKSEIHLYPNPIRDGDYLHLSNSFYKSELYKMKLYDMKGKLLRESEGDIKAIEKSLNYTLMELSSGTFLLRMEGADGEAFSIKLIKL